MRNIQTRALVLALLIFLGPATVHATVLTYNFSGTIAHFTTGSATPESESSLLLLIGTGLLGLGLLLRHRIRSV